MINIIRWLRSLFLIFSNLHLQHRHQIKHIFRDEIRLEIKLYIIIIPSTSAHWTEALIARGPGHSEFVKKAAHVPLYTSQARMKCHLYLACSSTDQPATGLLSTLMPYTHRMSSKLRLFLEQYAQGVSGRAPWPHTHHTPRQKHDSRSLDSGHFTSNLSCIILVVNK